MKRKVLNRFFASIAAISLLANTLIVPVSAYAQTAEETPPPTPEVTETPTPTDTPTETPTITPEVTPTPIGEVTPTPEITTTPTEEITPTPTEEITPTPIESGPTETVASTDESQPAEDNSQPSDNSGQQSPAPEVTATPIESGQAEEPTGTIQAIIIQDVAATSIELTSLSYNSDGTASITTDKLDYAPTDVVVITGTGFASSKEYDLVISGTGDFQFGTKVKSDESGALFYSYQLDGSYRPNYKVEVLSGNTVVATTTFTDSVVPDNKVKIDMYQFVISNSSAYSLVAGQPTGVGELKNGDVGAYPEGACIPVEIEVKNTDDAAGDIIVSPVYDFFNGVIGVSNLEKITTGLSDNPRSLADNLNDFGYPGTALTSVSSFAKSGGGTISATISGPYSGNNAGTSATTGTDAFRHYNITLSNVASHGTVYIILCGRLGLDASQYSGGSSLSIRTAQGGQENVPIPVNQILLLPSLTLTKVVDSGSATPDQWSFNVTPSINGQSIFPIPSGQSLVTIDNVSPDGSYTVIESGPGSYNFVSGSGETSCTFSGSTATATVAAGKPPTNASCTFHNALSTGTIVVHKDVRGPNGEDISDTSQNFTVRLDGNDPRTITDGGSVTYSNVPAGPHTITETIIPSGYSFYGFTPDSDGGTSGAQVAVTTDNTTDVYVVNRQQNATVTIHKNVLNPDGSEVSDGHQFTVQRGGTDDKTIAEETDAIYTVAPGQYTFTENPGTDYTLDSITGDNDGNAANGATLTVGPGGSAELTFVNKQKKATINVYKDVVKPDGQTDVSDSHHFTALLNGGTGQSFWEGSPTSYTANPGQYTILEDTDIDYVDLGCRLVTGADATNFNVPSNSTINVTCTNAQKSATITVEKDVIKYDGNPTEDNNIFEVTLNNETKPFSESGQAIFTVDPGTYSAVESAETGYSEYSNDSPRTVSSNGQATIHIVNNQDPLSISGYKFDADGQTGLEDWTIKLYSCLDNFLNCTYSTESTTDVNGFFSFGGLSTWLYKVEEVLQGGWTNLTDIFHNITLTPGVNSTGNNFVNFKLGKITVCKYDDLVGNGQYDASVDQPLSGISIKLSQATLIDTKETGADGCVTFEGLTVGTYRVEEDYADPDLIGYYSTNGITYHDVNITSGSDESRMFLNTLYRMISGTKYNDFNGNGSQDAGEPGLANWTIFLDANSNGVLDGGERYTTTDANGYYEFTNLVADMYLVTEVLKPGWIQIQPTAGYYNLNLDDNVSSTGNDFGNFKLASIGDFIWQDNNGDGVQDIGEPGIAGIDINLYNDDGDGIFEPGGDDGAPIATDTTDGTGGYLFENLGQGEYWIDVVDSTLPAGYANTTPDPVGPITLSSGQIYLLADVGYVPPVKGISIEKSNDKLGGASAGGDTVTYTLVITNTGNVAVGNVVVTDSLPGGFTYVADSTSIVGASDVEPIISGSTLKWNIGTVATGESVTISYQAKISSDLSVGTYKNIVTCEGLVLREEPISCNTDDSDVSIGQSFSYGGKLTPQVLGAATELPATGSPTGLVIFAIAAVLGGIAIKLREKKGKHAKN